MFMHSKFKQLSTALLAAVMATITMLPAPAQVLKGGVAEENLRLAPARSGRPLSGQADGMRIQRAPSALRGSAVDATAFAPPMNARTSPLEGVLDNNDFAKAPQNFDIGAERGSREMTLAWERWHKQLSQTIYTRWQGMAQDPGRATVRITVTSNRTIRAQILRSTGGREFDTVILAAIESINNNQGLTFPAKSVRDHVSFEADYIAASNVTPGFSWVKNDYEKVRENY